MRERIAVATRDGKSVNAHFGKTPFFFVFDVEDGEITLESRRDAAPAVASLLQSVCWNVWAPIQRIWIMFFMMCWEMLYVEALLCRSGRGRHRKSIL